MLGSRFLPKVSGLGKGWFRIILYGGGENFNWTVALRKSRSDGKLPSWKWRSRCEN